MRRSISAGIPWEESRKTILNPVEIAESDFRIQLINEITKARHNHGLSRKQLAELCSVHTSTISALENGSILPDISTLFKIIVPLDIDLTIHTR